jgi:hypothetical protein
MMTMRLPRLRKRTAAYLLACTVAGGALSVAGATVFFNGPITGTTANGSAPALYYASGAVTTTPDGSGVSCAAATTNASSLAGFDTTLNINISGALPGSVCTFIVHVVATDSGTVLQDISLGSSTGGYTAALDIPGGSDDCGNTVPPTDGDASAVTFTVTAPSGTAFTDGGTGTITGNLQAVPSAQYVAANCS